MKKDKGSLTNWFFILFFFGTIAFIIIAPIYIVRKIDKQSKLPRHPITRSVK